MGTLKQVGKGLYLLSVIAGLGIKTALQSSPAPFIHWLRRQPDPPPAAHPNAAEFERRVRIHRDLEYPSKFRSNTLDLYYAADGQDKRPTILWIHGGSFVAGDKIGTAPWCTVMAAHGYTVVSMNYEVAPEARYPAPVLQMGEVYEYLRTLADKHPAVDPNRLIVGGDSAGAQIASQFLAIQTNPELARLTGIRAVVPPHALQAALLYCGPYNVKQLANVKGRVSRFYLNQLGWAYMGDRNWRDSDHALHASTVHHVTPHFPPVMITDGNAGSFEPHARELAEKLVSAGVPVVPLFFPLSEGTVHHEYQFQLDTPEALRCLDMTLAFLRERVGLPD